MKNNAQNEKYRKQFSILERHVSFGVNGGTRTPPEIIETPSTHIVSRVQQETRQPLALDRSNRSPNCLCKGSGGRMATTRICVKSELLDSISKS